MMRCAYAARIAARTYYVRTYVRTYGECGYFSDQASPKSTRAKSEAEQ